MKNLKNILPLILVLLFTSCAQDDATTTDPITENPETQENAVLSIAESISILTDSGSGLAWKIDSATLTNDNVADLSLNDLYNIEDDTFSFFPESTTSITLNYASGLAINPEATDLTTVKTDKNSSNRNVVLTAQGDENPSFTFGDNFSFTLTDAGDNIKGRITYESGATLDVLLSPKEQRDYLKVPRSIDAVSSLFSFKSQYGGSMKLSQATDKLYVTHRVLTGSNQIQRAFAYDVVANQNTEISYSVNTFSSRSAEILNGKLVNITGSNYQIFDTNFSGVESFVVLNESDDFIWNFGATAVDDTAYLFGGNYQGMFDFGVRTWAIGDTTLENTPYDIPNLNGCDGEIVGNNLYVFGGLKSSDTGNQGVGSDQLYILDLDTGNAQTVQLPFALGFTNTSRIQDLIYVAGTTSEDTDSDGVVDKERNFLAAYDLKTGRFQEITLNVDATFDGQLMLDVQVTKDKVYLMTARNQGIEQTVNVYEANL